MPCDPLLAAKPPKPKNHGLSLIELMVSLALIAGLTVAGLPAMARQRSRQQASTQGWQLQADVLLAQSLSVSQGRPVRWAWLPASPETLACWWLMLGSATGCRCPEPTAVTRTAVSPPGQAFDQAATCPNGTVLLTRTLTSPWSLSSTATSVVFDPVRGTATPTFSLSLLQGNEVWLKHIINISGRLRSCSDRSIAGWPSCA